MQYHIWFLFLGILSIPLIPVQIFHFSEIGFHWIDLQPIPHIAKTIPKSSITVDGMSQWTQDFAISVNSNGIWGSLLCGIWMIGMIVMSIGLLRSYACLRRIQKSALPLQNAEVRKLYHHCLHEMGLKRQIPIYSTAFLKSPALIGFWKPGIYIPIYLISDYNATDMRLIFLHELEHQKHKDALINHLIHLFGIIYWFHPMVQYALHQMRNDREIACDAAVLDRLNPSDYLAYGNTLIRLAEKISFDSMPFVSSLIGNKKQIKQRMIQIANYETATFAKRIKGILSFALIALFLVCISPMLSTYASDENNMQWQPQNKNITTLDLSSYFGEYQGSFVLYDLENDHWQIHNMSKATQRIAPNSTYKIYDALFGLESGIITPSHSVMMWNGEQYPFAEWNANQTLQSAMQSSVNWYFQTIDAQLGKASVQHYIQQIGYGNQNIRGDLSSYWLESSLKISPIEQVELLTQLRNNNFDFAPENIAAVKNAIRMLETPDYTLYGKTGTGRVDGQDVNGWFIGYIETTDHTYFFATNISSTSNATGSQATKITMSILSNILK